METEVRITLRLPADLHARLTAQAKTDRRSLNAEIVHLLEAAIGTPRANSDSP
ncbi:toxin-antitoxin system HicB family antitoxin [Nonomuraea harbinensis]|uniref:Toxin-antitoxin system HicB family antitoxin n=1 Tax=Nonomuraea harbinensis TaxID=1286938 RepID=A0ABW1BQT4_9ACTN|nr:toxin-antitoxin system HicB family antitoxin [Nonomuraea harbinensis]